MNEIWPFSRRYQTIQSILKTAKRITTYYYQSTIESYTKENQTPVTVADCATQIYLIDQIRKYFPEDEIIAEEDNASLDENMIDQISAAFKILNIEIDGSYENLIQFRGKPSINQWTIDPIDGTEGFRRGLAYAIGIGLLINHIPSFCAIAVPNFQNGSTRYFFAEKHRGAYMQIESNDLTRIHIGQCREFTKAVLIKSLHHDRPISNEIISNFDIQTVISMDGMGKFCQVAMGSADVYFRPFSGYSLFAWDYCPGHILIEESGGLFTGFFGEIPIYEQNKCILKSNGILATNSFFHEKLIEFLKKK